MKTLTKILGLSIVTLGLLNVSNCDLLNSRCPEGMEKVSITKHGITSYLWYKDVCGQDYISKSDY